jgi:hypothetical protein
MNSAFSPGFVQRMHAPMPLCGGIDHRFASNPVHACPGWTGHQVPIR